MLANSDASPIIVGCGFLGKYLADLLQTQHQSPLCIVRSNESLNLLVASGYNTQDIDLDNIHESVEIPLQQQNVYYLAPPSSIDNCDYRIDRFLALCKANLPNKIVYISTSGVYGDCGGDWVDETHPLAPISERAKRRVYAEQAIKDFCQTHSTKYVILRVGGIYGPGRLPIHRLQNITVVCPEDAPYSNRIHVSDLANICYVAMTSKVENEVFNIADGHATTMTDYYYQIADFAGQARPPCVSILQAKDKLSASMLSFINESRRLSTQKMQVLLGVDLKFPTLSAGLENCFSTEH